jgi:electron transport complex protein RnfC
MSVGTIEKSIRIMQETPSGRGGSLAEMPIRRFPFAPELVLPLRQGMSGTAVPIVKEGQEVVRGEPIAEPLEYLSVAYHAPATGVVDRIDTVTDIDGRKVQAIVIRVYRASSQEILYGESVDVDSFSRSEINAAIRAAGIIGQGGFGFPTHAKLEPPDEKYVDALVINGCETGPDRAVARRVMVERTADLVRGLQLVLKASGAERAIVAVEPGATDALECLQKAIPAGTAVTVVAAPERFGEGSAKRMVEVLLGRQVPTDGLPLDVHAAVFHVPTLAQIGELLPRRGGLIERVVTFSGPAIEKPGNYLVPVGTPLDFALEQVGAASAATPVYLGNIAVERLDLPLTKEVDCVRVAAPKVDSPAERSNGQSHGLAALLKRFIPQRQR